MNEKADELAEMGRNSNQAELCLGPQKYGSVWQEQATECKEQLPRDSAPNKCILKQDILTRRKVQHTGSDTAASPRASQR